MEEKITSEGKCPFCNKMVTSRGMSRHLSTHLKALEEERDGQHTAYHVIVSNKPYFLHLLIDEKTKLGKLDDFLRAIWLECCGHLSAFMVKGQWGGDELELSSKAKKVFQNYSELTYDYDFGTTTRLSIKLINTYNIKAKESIQLLSRNEPLEILCDTCGKKPAVSMCTIHEYGEDCMFCESCGDKHRKKCEDFDDYSEMPVVNSPRSGECGYVGGTIDTDRDGVFELKK